ncbi:MAG: metal ABC transporter permease, partial [Corynebacterium sp.]|nr:metal ABC transporter permease [Corynebacterium sp.]
QAHVMGFNNTLIDALMFGSIAVATVIGLKSVGLVLMVAFIVTPPAIARQWTATAASMTVLSGLAGGVASAIGTWLSIAYGPMPTGPVIVVTLFVMLLGSLALSPRRRHAMAEA